MPIGGYKTIREFYRNDEPVNIKPVPKSGYYCPRTEISDSHDSDNSHPLPKTDVFPTSSAGELKMTWESTNLPRQDPSVWGPAFWFAMHSMAVSYPERPSPMCRENAKKFMTSLPYMLPCEGCFEHARAYIEKHEADMDLICSSRVRFFKFFVDMHNMVNERYNKPRMTVEDAWRLYGEYKLSYKMD